MSTIGYITNFGTLLSDDVLRGKLGPGYKGYLAKMTITTPQKIGPPKTMQLYSYIEEGGRRLIVVPRGHVYTYPVSGLGIIKPCWPTPQYMEPICPHETCECARSALHQNQMVVVDYLLDQIYTGERIEEGRGSALLNVRAGLGKTFIAAEIIARMRLRTIYVVPKCPLAQQAQKDLIGYFTARGGRVPEIGLGYGEINILVINTALTRSNDFYDGYSAIILDEVHCYCTSSRRAIFNRCMRVVLGLSATTSERADGFDQASHAALALDGVIFASEIPGFDDQVANFDCTVRVIRYTGPPEHTQALTHEKTGEIFVHYMYQQMLGDPHRTDVIVAELIQLYDWSDGELRHGIYVFAEEIQILREIYGRLDLTLRGIHRQDIADDMGYEFGLEMFIGGSKPEDISRIASSPDSRILFSTYAYAGTGVSILRMTAMVLATPRKTGVKQIVARILRRGSDPRIPRIVVDIVDTRICLARQYKTRSEVYEYYNFRVEKFSVKR